MPMSDLSFPSPVIDLSELRRDAVCIVMKRKMDEYLFENIHPVACSYFRYSEKEETLTFIYEVIDRKDKTFIARSFKTVKEYVESTFNLKFKQIEKIDEDKIEVNYVLSKKDYDTLEVLFKMEGYDLEKISQPYADMFQNCTSLTSVDFSSLLKHKK